MFMPTHRADRDRNQDLIRFKNLLQEVEKRLLANDLRLPDVREMLAPAQLFLKDTFFWQKQSDGLALFFNSDSFRSYRLPLQFEELVVISNYFHFKPLLPYFAGDSHFYILALSQNKIKLMEGTRHLVNEVDLESTLPNLAQAMQYEDYIKQVQFHTGTSSQKSRDRPAMIHGQDPSEEDKNRILRWFYKVDDALSNTLADKQSPMVLAGVKFLFSLYKKANSYSHLIEEGIPGNPEQLSLEALHAKAWPLIQPIFMKAQEQAVAQYHALTNKGQTTSDIQEAVLAAYYGRVDTLFVAVNDQVWGNFDPDSKTVQVHQEHEAGDQDLLDLAAIKSILNGGTVYAVEPDKVPGDVSLAAVLRY